METKQPLAGQIAVVTGAGRGIGAAAAVALGKAGADLVLLSRTRKDLDQVASALSAAGGTARIVVCDVTNAEQARIAQPLP